MRFLVMIMVTISICSAGAMGVECHADAEVALASTLQDGGTYVSGTNASVRAEAMTLTQWFDLDPAEQQGSWTRQREVEVQAPVLLGSGQLLDGETGTDDTFTHWVESHTGKVASGYLPVVETPTTASFLAKARAFARVIIWEGTESVDSAEDADPDDELMPYPANPWETLSGTFTIVPAEVNDPEEDPVPEGLLGPADLSGA